MELLSCGEKYIKQKINSMVLLQKIIKGEMIGKLTLYYNRTRQAVITRELIEIISGASALDSKE
jgi:F0F1-type ATP synthase gamma subunit